MEVASPLTFDHGVAGSKRQFPCSPFDKTNRSPFAGMDSTDEFVQQRCFKRRRFAVDESMEGDTENNINQSPFLSHSAHPKPILSSSNGESHPPLLLVQNLYSVCARATDFSLSPQDVLVAKRQMSLGSGSMQLGLPLNRKDVCNKSRQTFKRHRSDSTQNDLQRVVNAQATEIQSLKSEKQNLESSMNGLKAEHEKVLNENRILKRAVTIQQERQNQAGSEIAAAHKYKFEADDRIKKLEQIILSLRYHLQAQHTNAGNDFMGTRPPDVY
eukprot:scaffold993_cov110-Cylindrotheca_fusiformis.AAC.12